VEIVGDTEKHANPMGTIHGGVLCDIADAAIGTAHATTLETGESLQVSICKSTFSVRSGMIGYVLSQNL
jgi:acyl-coenzyme A thioesterase PaaI-like protein